MCIVLFYSSVESQDKDRINGWGGNSLRGIRATRHAICHGLDHQKAYSETTNGSSHESGSELLDISTGREEETRNDGAVELTDKTRPIFDEITLLAEAIGRFEPLLRVAVKSAPAEHRAQQDHALSE